jgi:hypothetical protein
MAERRIQKSGSRAHRSSCFELLRHRGKTLHQLAGDVRRQRIDQRPGAALAQQPLDQRQVGRRQPLAVQLEELDAGGAQLVDGPAPELLHERDHLRSREVGMRLAQRLARPLHRRHRRAQVLELALEIALLLRRPRRCARGRELVGQAVGGSPRVERCSPPI